MEVEPSLDKVICYFNERGLLYTELLVSIVFKIRVCNFRNYRNKVVKSYKYSYTGFKLNRTAIGLEVGKDIFIPFRVYTITLL